MNNLEIPDDARAEFTRLRRAHGPTSPELEDYLTHLLTTFRRPSQAPEPPSPGQSLEREDLPLGPGRPNAEQQAQELGGRIEPGILNWTWARDFPNEAAASAFVRWLAQSGFDSGNGVVQSPPGEILRWSVRYR